MEIINNFNASNLFNFKKLIVNNNKIKYENSCGATPIAIAKTRINSEMKIVLRGVNGNIDISLFLLYGYKKTGGGSKMEDGIIQRNLNEISIEENAELVKAIIKIAHIIYNSGIIVGEKLGMPNDILFGIRTISDRASGYANGEEFFTRDLNEIFHEEKGELSNAIKKIADITHSDIENIIRVLEIPERLDIQKF